MGVFLSSLQTSCVVGSHKAEMVTARAEPRDIVHKRAGHIQLR